MNKNNSLIVYKENLFTKLKNFFRNIFSKKEVQIIQEREIIIPIGEKKKNFIKMISFKENKEELDLINKVRQNPEILMKMNAEELNELENAIKNRQDFVDKKIAKLKTDLSRKKRPA